MSWFKQGNIEIVYNYSIKPIIDTGVKWYHCEVYYDPHPSMNFRTVRSEYFQDKSDAEEWIAKEKKRREG